jgi:hypothetical protein
MYSRFMGAGLLDGPDDLDLGGALVDVGDAGVAVEALHRILAHETVAAVNLDGVVGDAVAHSVV